MIIKLILIVKPGVRLAAALEELNGPLVLLGGRPGLEGSQVAAFAGLGILLS
jgi:hypothetical protein